MPTLTALTKQRLIVTIETALREAGYEMIPIDWTARKMPIIHVRAEHPNSSLPDYFDVRVSGPTRWP